MSSWYYVNSVETLLFKEYSVWAQGRILGVKVWWHMMNGNYWTLKAQILVSSFAYGYEM